MIEVGSKGKRYSPTFQFQVVLEVLKGDREATEIARAYNIHPVTLSRWKQEFLEKGAKENTYMESFNGHFKGESGSLFGDARNIWELRRAIADQIEYYNVTRRHSALGYVSPWAYVKQEVTLPEPTLDLAQISS